MFFRLSFRVFVIAFLIFSIGWVAATFLPVLYSIVFPPADIRQIVRALELRSEASPNTANAVEEIIDQVGPLQRAIPVGYYRGISATLHYNDSHIGKTTQVSYVAWFQKTPRPTLLLITKSERDGVLSGYQLEEGAAMSLVVTYALPLVMLTFSFLLLKSRNWQRFKHWHT
jgi:hypothetical protein